MLTRWAVLPPAGMVRLNAQRAIEKAVYRRCCRGQRRLDGTAGKGSARVDTTQGRGERLDYAPAGCQPQRVSRAETSGSHEHTQSCAGHGGWAGVGSGELYCGGGGRLGG